MLIPYTHVLDHLEFSGREIRSTVVLNPEEQSSMALKDEEDAELKGPVVRGAARCVASLCATVRRINEAPCCV